MSGRIRSGLHLLQFLADGSSKGPKGGRRLADDFIRLFLSVCPDFQKAIQAFTCRLLCALKVSLRYAKEAQAVAPAIEGVGSGIFPAFSCFLHALQRFAGFLRT